MRKRPPTPPAPIQPPPDGRVSDLSRNVRIGLSAFVAFHLFCIVFWCIPIDSPLIVRFRESVKPYVLWTGLFQKWDMFAPDPSKLNNYVGAILTYRDGRTAEWDFPRMENLGYVDRYFKERYRKYANDNLRIDARSALWPDAARYVARLNAADPANPPVEVALVRHWSEVPPPGAHGEPPPSPWNQYVFFRYPVQPGDLK
jgi:hypothetical protein